MSNAWKIEYTCVFDTYTFIEAGFLECVDMWKATLATVYPKQLSLYDSWYHVDSHILHINLLPIPIEIKINYQFIDMLTKLEGCYDPVVKKVWKCIRRPAVKKNKLNDMFTWLTAVKEGRVTKYSTITMPISWILKEIRVVLKPNNSGRHQYVYRHNCSGSRWNVNKQMNTGAVHFESLTDYILLEKERRIIEDAIDRQLLKPDLDLSKSPFAVEETVVAGDRQLRI